MNKEAYVKAVEIMLNLPAGSLSSLVKANQKDIKTLTEALIKLSDRQEANSK